MTILSGRDEILIKCIGLTLKSDSSVILPCFSWAWTGVSKVLNELFMCQCLSDEW